MKVRGGLSVLWPDGHSACGAQTMEGYIISVVLVTITTTKTPFSKP